MLMHTQSGFALRSVLLGISLALGAVRTFAQTPGPARARRSFNAAWRCPQGDPADAADQLRDERIKDQLVPAGSEVNDDAARSGTPGGGVLFVQIDFVDGAGLRL